MVKKYLLYHQYTIITNLYLKLSRSVSFLIHILQVSARPLSIIASCQQDLQLDFSNEEINNMIKKLDPNKPHGHEKYTYVETTETVWGFNKQTIRKHF